MVTRRPSYNAVMGPTATRMTVEQFMELSNEELHGRELIRGELVETGNAGQHHEKVKAKLNALVVSYLLRNPVGELFPETLYKVSEDTGFIPDLSVQVPARKLTGTGPFQGAPELAMEVVSSEPAADLMHKVDSYLTNGSLAVWLVYPDSRDVWVYHPDGAARRYSSSDVLEEPSLLPGFQLPVATLFEGPD